MSTFNFEIERLAKAKSDIKQAIEEKGVAVGDGLIGTYADKIKQIKVMGKQQNKTATITKNNTTSTFVADDGYVGLDKVTVKTQIPIQDAKSIDIADNGSYSVVVDEGYEGLKKVNVDVNIPLQEDKVVEFTDNGTYNVSVDDEYKGMKNVEVSVNLPIQPNKSIDITENGSYSVSKDADYVGVETVSIDVNIPIQEEKELLVKSKGTYTITPDDGYVGLKKGTVVVDVKEESGKPKLPNGICLSDSTWTEFDMNDYDWSLVYDYGEMFRECRNLTSLKLVPTQPMSCIKMFYSDGSLSEINGIEQMDVSKVRNMSEMFRGCKLLTSLDLFNWDTSNVTDMSYLFYGCYEITEIKMGGDVSKVTNVFSIFGLVSTTGTFYYNNKYDYSKIIAELPKNWTAVPMTITE